MNIEAIRTWLTAECPRLLSMAHYNRDYMYLPAPTGKNSAYAHDIITTVLDILANMSIKLSNIFVCRYIFMMSWNDISTINRLTRRQNLYLNNKALTYFGNEFKRIY